MASLTSIVLCHHLSSFASVSQSVTVSHRTTRAAHKWQWLGGFRPSWQRRPVTSTIIMTPKSHGAALWRQTMSFSILPCQSPPPLVSHLLNSTAHSFIDILVTDPFLDLGFYFFRELYSAFSEMYGQGRSWGCEFSSGDTCQAH